jgi:ATP adenylyltransferase
MDFLWSPWRYHYIRANADGTLRPEGCVFCHAPTVQDLSTTLVVARGERSFVIMNLFPYTSGHVMVVPYAHVSSLAQVEDEAVAEIMGFVKRSQQALDDLYRPDGYNVGMNIGKAAGAGIEQHLHMHVVPRWVGDSNFVSVLGETRVIPEDLQASYAKLSGWFAEHE